MNIYTYNNKIIERILDNVVIFCRVLPEAHTVGVNVLKMIKNRAFNPWSVAIQQRNRRRRFESHPRGSPSCHKKRQSM